METPPHEPRAPSCDYPGSPARMHFPWCLVYGQPLCCPLSVSVFVTLRSARCRKTSFSSTVSATTLAALARTEGWDWGTRVPSLWQPLLASPPPWESSTRLTHSPSGSSLERLARSLIYASLTGEESSPDSWDRASQQTGFGTCVSVNICPAAQLPLLCASFCSRLTRAS